MHVGEKLMSNTSRLVRSVLALAVLFGGALALQRPAGAQINSLTPDQAEETAKEAYIYGTPMVQGYGVMFAYAVYKDNSQYKAPFNEIANVGRVFTPQDTAIITPNSDTPYSFVWADLRAEPLVLQTPAIQKNRYWSIQFVDLYTWNFAYAGTRTTGNDEGRILLAGPNWKGDTPRGITTVVRSDTDFVLAGYRTQLFNAADIDNVRKIQAGYTIEPLSKFLSKSAPPAPPKIDFLPYIPEKVKSLGFFNYLSFLLQFCPIIPEDKATRESFTKIGIEPGKTFNPDAFSPEMRKALEAGIAEGQKEIMQNLSITDSATHLFGTREFMKNNYLQRATAAEAGIYGNSEDEAFYFAYYKDQNDAVLDGAKGTYTMHFDKGKFPPVHAFWSVTLYDARTKLLSANPINRYFINSPMLSDMKFDDAGSVTIYIQKDSPGKDKESNWLPAPDEPFFLQFRCYWPKEAVLDGSWQPPAVVKAN
jgi:hypothetical protein